MRYFLDENGLQPITQTDAELSVMFAVTNDVGDTPTEYQIEEMLACENILFKHPSVSLEALCTITGDNGTSDEVCHRIVEKALDDAEDCIKVICFVNAEKHHRYSYYNINVHYMNLATYRLHNLLRNRVIDDLLPTL